METTTAASALTQEVIDRLKAAHSGADLRSFENEEFGIVDWVMKVPAPGDYQAFRAQQNGAGDDLMPVLKSFALNHIVHPATAEVQMKFKAHAGLIEAIVKYLLKLAGTRAEFVVKKL